MTISDFILPSVYLEIFTGKEKSALSSSFNSDQCLKLLSNGQPPFVVKFFPDGRFRAFKRHLSTNPMRTHFEGILYNREGGCVVEGNFRYGMVFKIMMPLIFSLPAISILSNGPSIFGVIFLYFGFQMFQLILRLMRGANSMDENEIFATISLLIKGERSVEAPMGPAVSD